MINNNSAKKIKITTTIISMLVFLLISVLIYQFVVIKNLEARKKSLFTQLNNLEENIYFYSQENKYLSSSEYYEDYAREVLGFGKNGEIRFISDK